MENTVNAKPVATPDWTYVDGLDPYTRVMRTAAALEGMAVGVRIAALHAVDPETLQVVLSGTAELMDQTAAVLVAQGSRMEDCPYCSHQGPPLEVNPEDGKRAEAGADGAAPGNGNGAEAHPDEVKADA